MLKYFFFILICFTPATALAFPAKVVNVQDGDSLTVLTCDKESIKIRLYGIDAPELKQPFGKAAKRKLNKLAAGKDVFVDEVNRDRYGRMVAMVYLNDVSLNELMVFTGHAWVFDRYCPKKSKVCQRLRHLQVYAQIKKGGLWRGKEPVPPWEWRKFNGNRQRNSK